MMGLRLARLDETNRPAFEKLLAQVWELDCSDELARAVVRWRYDERSSGGGTWLVCDDGECVAMLDSFLRPYLLNGRRIHVREGCDWYCLPKYRGMGLGIRLMKKMMACDEPMISIGGSEWTRAILPKLGWTRLPDVQSYLLPLRARDAAGAMLRNRWPVYEAYVRAVPDLPLRRLRRAAAPRADAASVEEWRPGGTAHMPLPRGDGLVELLEPGDLDWMGRTPVGLARPFGLTFSLGREPVGFSLAQVEPGLTGLDGRIVHVLITHEAQEVADWVIAETAIRLAALGAGMIRCLASTPQKNIALRRAGFVSRAPLPSYWWSNSVALSPSASDIGYLRADDAIPFAALRAHNSPSSEGEAPVSRAGA
jgi:hypothetical protein